MRLAANILSFARTLRAAGLPVGPGQILEAIAAARTVGIRNREDFYWCLSATLVQQREQRELFAQAFHVFFRNPRILEEMMSLMLPQLQRSDVGREPVLRRLAEAFAGNQPSFESTQEAELELDATLTSSATEMLQRRDFEQMSGAELIQAKAMLRQCDLLFHELPTRRYQPAVHGNSVDRRATMRAALRTGGRPLRLVQRRPRRRTPPLVVICDISGSMGRYSRLFLHFAHSLTAARERVSTFVFATRLTHITPQLRHKDVDAALDDISREVQDFSSGTRIGDCLAHFNRQWSRRVLAQGAIVLLVTDGLERGRDQSLPAAAERLQKSSRRLIWLNPLLRYADFQPRAFGVRCLLPFVDEFRPAHNIENLLDLGRALGKRVPAAATRRRHAGAAVARTLRTAGR